MLILITTVDRRGGWLVDIGRERERNEDGKRLPDDESYEGICLYEGFCLYELYEGIGWYALYEDASYNTQTLV